RTEGSTRAPSPHSLHAALPIWKPARNTLYSVNWVLTAPWDTIWAGRSRRMRNQQETRGYMSGKIRQYFRDKKDDVQDYAGGSGVIGKLVLVLLVVYLLVAMVLGIIWSSEPDTFSVREHTRTLATS